MSTEDEKPHIVIPFDLEGEDDEKAFIQMCRQKFAEEIAKMYRSQRKAIASLKSRGSTMTEATLSEWKK